MPQASGSQELTHLFLELYVAVMEKKIELELKYLIISLVCSRKQHDVAVFQRSFEFLEDWQTQDKNL